MKAFMPLREKVQNHFMHLRFFNSVVDWSKLSPLILGRIKARKKESRMVSIAYDVLKARLHVIKGVSTLLKVFPLKSCKFCSEIYVGDTGHQIKTCEVSMRRVIGRAHQWTDGNVNDILPVESFHISNNSEVPTQDQRSCRRITAVEALCLQVGAEISAESSYLETETTTNMSNLSSLAEETLKDWETLRLGVQKLLLSSPAKVCQLCTEVHVGPSMYKPRLDEDFDDRGCNVHRWKSAEVDDLVPRKMVWHRRPQDPTVLVEGGRNFYGRAPAVVELCTQAGARVPVKYRVAMKSLGRSI